MTRYFVTGTGTSVGKTFVTTLLVKQAVAVGQRVFAFKPIETGCLEASGGLGEDQERLAVAAGDWQQADLRHLYCFKAPLAPFVAAKKEGKSINLFHVKQAFDHGQKNADAVLVEGAGGWRVPITETEDMASLAKLLDLPVIVVGATGLGTINHCLLTIEAVRSDGCKLAQVILSRRPEEDLGFARENGAEIARAGRCEVVLSDDVDWLKLARGTTPRPVPRETR